MTIEAVPDGADSPAALPPDPVDATADFDAPGDEAIEASGDEALEDEALEDEALEDEALEDEALEDEALEDEALEDEALEAREVGHGADGPRPGGSAVPSKGALPGKAVRHLRGLGHGLAPVVAVGKHGVTDAVVAQTKQALLAHELIKVKVQSEAPESRHEAADALADATGAVLAQVLGRTFLLYKRHPKQPKIVLPGVKKGARAAAF